MTEREMQNLFVKSTLINTYKNKNYTIFEEVEYPKRCDVVAYWYDNIVAFELKLTDVKKVIEQAQTNAVCGYDYSYIVIPENKYKLIESKYMKEIEAFNIGIILYNPERKRTFYAKRKPELLENSCKSTINQKARCQQKKYAQKKFLVDQLIRGFYLGGVRERRSYR